MNVLRTEAAPPNSVVLLSEPGWGEVPKSMQNGVIAATPTCIAIGCRSSADGATEFVLGSLEDLSLPAPPAYTGTLLTPRSRIALQTVYNEVILEMRVPAKLTPVVIWVNDPIEPDSITISVDCSRV